MAGSKLVFSAHSSEYTERYLTIYPVRGSPMKKNRQKSPLIFGTLLLAASGIIARIAGFFYRIFLSQKISTEAMGLYQLVYPVYGICFSLCCGAVQTSVSRFVAAEYRKKNEGESRRYLACGLFLALALAVTATFIIYRFAPFLAEHILLEPRAEKPLRILSFSVPLSAIHACICGYYYGISKAQIPAAAQITEQFIRILTVIIVIHVAEASGREITAVYAVIGHLAGEAGALCTSLLAFSRRPRIPKNASGLPAGFLFKGLLVMALPLMGNRLIISFLQGIEAIMIPGCLKTYGLASGEALSMYGVLTGMAIPFILFPTAITGSLSVMLLPHIAAAQSDNAFDRINSSAGFSIRYSLYIGILFTGIFLRFGNRIGPIIFHNSLAGDFLSVLAWLCPFLYISGTAGSVINGLGYTKTTFLHSAVSLIIRLLFVVFLIPRMGIRAYLYGLLGSELVLTSWHLLFLRRKIELPFSPAYEILRPALSALLAMGISIAWESLSIHDGLPDFLDLAVSGILFSVCFLFFLFVTRKESD